MSSTSEEAIVHNDSNHDASTVNSNSHSVDNSSHPVVNEGKEDTTTVKQQQQPQSDDNHDNINNNNSNNTPVKQPDSQTKIPAKSERKGDNHKKESRSLNKTTSTKGNSGNVRSSKSRNPVNFTNFAEDEINARPVNTPLSTEACARYGVEPEDLVKKDKKYYYQIGMSEEHLQNKYDFMEKNRREKLKEVKQIYEYLKESGPKNNSLDNGPLVFEELSKKEAEKVAKFKERRKAEVAQAILGEIARYEREKEIITKLQDKEHEKRAQIENYKKEVEMQYNNKREKVKQRMEAVLELQKQREEDLRKQFEDNQAKLEEKRRAYDEAIYEKRKKSQESAEEKMKRIQEVNAKIQQYEEKKRLSAQNKQSQAEQRLEKIRQEKQKEEEMKQLHQSERERKRQEIAEKKRLEDEEKRNRLLLKQKHSEQLLHTILEHKRKEIIRRSEELKLKGEEKLDQVQRKKKAEAFVRDQSLQKIQENMKKIEQYKQIREQLIIQRKQNTQHNIVQRKKVQEYLFEMKCKKKYEVPEWLGINLDDYREMRRTLKSKSVGSLRDSRKETQPAPRSETAEPEIRDEANHQEPDKSAEVTKSNESTEPQEEHHKISVNKSTEHRPEKNHAVKKEKPVKPLPSSLMKSPYAEELREKKSKKKKSAKGQSKEKTPDTDTKQDSDNNTEQATKTEENHSDKPAESAVPTAKEETMHSQEPHKEPETKTHLDHAANSHVTDVEKPKSEEKPKEEVKEVKKEEVKHEEEKPQTIADELDGIVEDAFTELPEEDVVHHVDDPHRPDASHHHSETVVENNHS